MSDDNTSQANFLDITSTNLDFDWTIDFDELRRAITPRTKMLIVNTPHNPVGKVFSREELEKIAALAIEHNFIVMSDEVVRILICWTSVIDFPDLFACLV